MKWKGKNPYRDMDNIPEEETHPLDIYAKERIPQSLTDNIQLYTNKLLEALGNDASPWIPLEEVMNKYRLKREEVYFNLGHEYGCLAGSTHMKSRNQKLSKNTAYQNLSHQIHRQIVLSGLSPKLCITLLLDTVSAILEESTVD